MSALMSKRVGKDAEYRGPVSVCSDGARMGHCCGGLWSERRRLLRWKLPETDVERHKGPAFLDI